MLRLGKAVATKPNKPLDTAPVGMAILEELEDGSLMFVSGIEPKPLDESRIDELRRAFAARW